jgi:streptolysin S family bacteriocin protoxin
MYATLLFAVTEYLAGVFVDGGCCCCCCCCCCFAHSLKGATIMTGNAWKLDLNASWRFSFQCNLSYHNLADKESESFVQKHS